MADYKAMYLTLFNKITGTIEELKRVQQQVEEMYLSADEPQLIALPKKKDAE